MKNDTLIALAALDSLDAKHEIVFSSEDNARARNNALRTLDIRYGEQAAQFVENSKKARRRVA